MITVVDDYYNENKSKQCLSMFIKHQVCGRSEGKWVRPRLFCHLKHLAELPHGYRQVWGILCFKFRICVFFLISYLKTLSLFHLPPALSSDSPKMPNMFTNMINVFSRWPMRSASPRRRRPSKSDVSEIN